MSKLIFIFLTLAFLGGSLTLTGCASDGAGEGTNGAVPDILSGGLGN